MPNLSPSHLQFKAYIIRIPPHICSFLVSNGRCPERKVRRHGSPEQLSGPKLPLSKDITGLEESREKAIYLLVKQICQLECF
jgi:hypothetical protein